MGERMNKRQTDETDELSNEEWATGSKQGPVLHSSLLIIH
jgi:hypothetical protein